jgi:DNA adenine methylase
MSLVVARSQVRCALHPKYEAKRPPTADCPRCRNIWSARRAAERVESRLDVTRPFLKWVGGKRQLLPELSKYVPAKFGRYYEPFVGGGALFFDLRASGWAGEAVLGDSNALLIETYKGIRDDVELIINYLGKMRYDRDFYVDTRADQPDPYKASATRVAAWFIYINKCGFNGLFRVNKSGQCNVPFGRYDNPTICDEPRLRACSVALRKTILDCDDFERVIQTSRKGDLVYFDSPYVPISASSNFTGYTPGGFDYKDQVRLRDLAWSKREQGVHVILSNADVPLVRELYAKFDIHAVEARRNINSKATARGKVGEVIIT